PLLGGRPPEHRDQEGAPPSPRGSASSDAVPAPTSQGRALKADVIAFVGEHASASVEGLYRTASGALGRMIAVCDSQAGAALRREPQGGHRDLIVFGNEAALGRIASWNRGLLVRERDVLLVDGVTPAESCLEEMLEVLHASDRIASVSPLLERPTPAANVP